jgi:hypothetical protein|eukprot:6408930-Prymnesium_polylepis.2
MGVCSATTHTRRPREVRAERARRGRRGAQLHPLSTLFVCRRAEEQSYANAWDAYGMLSMGAAAGAREVDVHAW